MPRRSINRRLCRVTRHLVLLASRALGVADIYRACDALRAKGAKITREPGPMKHGTTEIAFVEDPDGYKIELIQLK